MIQSNIRVVVTHFCISHNNDQDKIQIRLWTQSGAVIAQWIFSKISTRTLHSLPVRAIYGLSFEESNFDLYSAKVTAVIFAKSFIESHYNGILLYFSLILSIQLFPRPADAILGYCWYRYNWLNRHQAITWTNANLLLIWNKFQWNLDQNETIILQENWFENAICKMVVICLSLNFLRPSDAYICQ